MLFASCKDEPPENKPPTANAGVNGGTLVDGKYEFDFTSPGNRSITLKGSGADTDGSIKSYAWTCTKKPGGATDPVFSATAQNPTVNGFTKLGDYEFSLKVKDNEDADSVASVVTVALYRTAETTVGISATTFNTGTSLNFAPIYTSSNETDFPVANIDDYITYKVTATNGSPGEWDGADGPVTVPVIADYKDKWTTFTQTFSKDKTELSDKRIFEVYVSGVDFQYYGGESGSWDTSVSFSAINGISLSRKISEGNVQ
jgi:hypothetical protein